MKLGKIFFISVLIICICLTFWQKDNLKYIWDEYWALQKSYCFTKENGLTPRIPVIKEKIAKSDPEATAIINYKLDYTLYRLGDEQRIEVLSRNILKFPDNQYFIYMLTCFAFDHLENGLDPAILLKLSNRLIELDGKNAAYRYLKAYALFCDRTGNNFDEVSKIIKQAQKCEYYKSSYSIYKDRAISMARKQGLHNRLIEELNFDVPCDPFIRTIYKTLIQYQNLLITEDDFTKADEISDLLKSMLNKMDKPMRHSLPYPLGFGGGFGYWNLPQEVELQRKNLTTQEADQKRLEICAIVNPENKTKLTNRYYETEEKKELYAIAVLPFVYFVRMAEVFIFLTIILSTFSLFRREELKIKTKASCLIRFFIYGSVYFLAGQFMTIAAFFDSFAWGCNHFSYMEVFLFPPLLYQLDLRDIKDLLDAPLHILVLPIGPLVIVFSMGIIRFFKPKFDNIVSRFISGVLIAIPLGIVTTILHGHTYLKYLPVIIFILFAFKYSFRSISLRSVFKAFGGSCKNEIPALRTDLLKLSVIAAVLCWLGLVLLAYPTKKSMEREEREVKDYTYLPEKDYEKAYQDVLKKIDDVNFPEIRISSYISWVQSNDLPKVMEKLKKRKPPFYPAIPAMRSPDFRAQENKDCNALMDRYISFLLQNAGRDQVPVIISYMNNPDDSWALVYRARLGDKSVKDKLTKVLNEAIKEEIASVNAEERENRMEPRMFELVSSLSAISGPDEAYSLVKEYFDTHSANQSNRYFDYKCFCTLPKSTVLKILDLYLDKAKNEMSKDADFRRCNLLASLRGLEGLYWDSETVKKVLSLILLEYNENGRRLQTFGIEYYLAPEATDILIKGLQSDNEGLRAWCVWQLKKINYKSSENELRKIAEDKSWKVRANLAIFDKSLIKENETSDFVKLVKSL